MATPWAATVFTAEGNYGSTVFDYEYGYLKISICDECLTAATKKGQVLHCQPRPVQEIIDEKPWKVPDE